MFVSLSTRSVPVPVASAIVTLPDAFAAGNNPLGTVTLSMRTSCPSNASPFPLASCDSVTTCGAGDVEPVDTSDTAVTVTSVNPLNCSAGRFDRVAEAEWAEVQTRAEEIDAAGRILDVVLDAVAAAEVDRRHDALGPHDLIQTIRDEVRAGRPIRVAHLVDPRLANRQQRRRRGRGRAEIDAAPRRDVVVRVERPEEIVLLNDPGQREHRRR